MRLHENSTLFRQAVAFTAQEMKINAVYVEKDYWVTYALHTIFHNPIGQQTVFKGGTALSKCYSLVERFSEDIDLVVLKAETESSNQLSKKIREIGQVVSAELPEVEIAEVTQKMGMNRKTAHQYPKVFSGNYGQVRDVIIVEATWLGYFEPYTTKPVTTYIQEMMNRVGQNALIAEYEMQPFDVQVLEPSRTICEKIMSLVRFSYGADPLDDLKKKIRHAYDLHQLLKDADLAAFFDSPAFEEMLLKVANDDVVSYKNNNGWLNHHPNQAKIFAELDTVWDDLRETYQGDFKNLVFGILPPEEEVKATLQKIKDRLSAIDWTVNT